MKLAIAATLAASAAAFAPTQQVSFYTCDGSVMEVWMDGGMRILFLVNFSGWIESRSCQTELFSST